MHLVSTCTKDYTPVAVGGLGGSGTRLIASILTDLGFYIGSDLNQASDNLWFTFLFKRLEILTASDEEFKNILGIFLNAMSEQKAFTEEQKEWINRLTSPDRPQDPIWLQQRAQSLLKVVKEQNATRGPWGWKEPNTHIVLDRFMGMLPCMKYIHVARHGLDMAYSHNQNQLKLWGSFFLDSSDIRVTPYYSLRYWCKTHQRVLEIGKTMGQRFLLLNFDRFCRAPREGLAELFQFLNIKPSRKQIESLIGLIAVPGTIGRFRQYGLDVFDPQDIEFVKNLGFDTRIT